MKKSSVRSSNTPASFKLLVMNHECRDKCHAYARHFSKDTVKLLRKARQEAAAHSGQKKRIPLANLRVHEKMNDLPMTRLVGGRC